MKPEKLTHIAMVIGAMKSGTSTLFKVLKHHPELAPTKLKEVNFFAHPERWGKGLSWYEDSYDFDPARHKWAIEASTDQSKFPYTDYVLDRMEKLEGVDWKFIYILRHPMRRIESHHKHAWSTGAEIMRLKSDDQRFSFDDRISPIAIDTSRYAFQADHYVERWGRESLKIVLFEDLVSDWDATMVDVCEFLGIDPDAELPANLHTNKRKATKATGAWRTVRKLGPLQKAYTSLVPVKARKEIRSRFVEQEVEPRFKLNDEEEAKILAELKDDLVRLRDVYGVDVEGKWGLDIGA